MNHHTRWYLADVINHDARCLCSHPRAHHGFDRKNRPVCWSAACGCIEFREDTRPDPEIPARFDERYDPSPEPIDRKTK